VLLAHGLRAGTYVIACEDRRVARVRETIDQYSVPRTPRAGSGEWRPQCRSGVSRTSRAPTADLAPTASSRGRRSGIAMPAGGPLACILNRDSERPRFPGFRYWRWPRMASSI